MGCTLSELKEILKDHDTNMRTNLEVIEWIRQKMSEVERKKDDLDQILETLNWMLEYRMALMKNSQRSL
ncbi:MerR family DNA-binding protein [Ferroacidibacillus organovorans]|uniref:MerR family DNA-binding protein n=1 Tax=Ferroacidibacillus organovorans TaxID=1765683 RepID=UPI0022B23E95|nr:MerR family DNA-binding protein [Ferroacidibacillus organovorans]